MFYPITLLGDDEQAPNAKFDVEPVVLQFELYVRFVMAVAYDRCRQLLDREDRAGLRTALAAGVTPEPLPLSPRPLEEETYRACVRAWGESMKEHCPELAGCLNMTVRAEDAERILKKGRNQAGQPA